LVQKYLLSNISKDFLSFFFRRGEGVKYLTSIKAFGVQAKMPAYLGSGYPTGIKWTSSPKKQPTKPEVNTNKVQKKRTDPVPYSSYLVWSFYSMPF
jgi:hypothetical protein